MKRNKAGRPIEGGSPPATEVLCPEGHKIGHEGPQGRCTPIWCSGGNGQAVRLKRRTAKQSIAKQLARVTNEAPEAALALKQQEDELPEFVKDADSKDLFRTEKARQAARNVGALARHQARKAFVTQAPKDTKGADAEEWARRRMVDLLPAAVAEIEYGLLYGTDKERYEMADKVLDANGMKKRDAGSGGGATIILNLNTKELPWAEKIVNAVDGKVMSSPSLSPSSPASSSAPPAPAPPKKGS